MYGRVSTDDQADMHGLDAQRAACRRLCRSVRPAIWTHDVCSGRIAPDDRPALSAALRGLAAGRYRWLVVAELSRLGRSVRDVAELADRARAEGWGIIIGDLGVDITTPAGELVYNVLASVYQFERRNLAERTREGMAAAKAKGVRLGAPAAPHIAAAGRRVAELRADGATWDRIVEQLTAEGHRTAKGGPWSHRQARRAMRTAALDAEALASAAS